MSETVTKTNELRRMLDEAGVEWVNIRNDGSKSDYFTEWQFDGTEGHAIATEWAVGHLTVCIAHPMTPEQAIAATLGSSNCTNSERTGTCRNSAPIYLDFLCSECGFVHYHSDANDTGDGNEWCFCPNCGRKVVDE